MSANQSPKEPVRQHISYITQYTNNDKPYQSPQSIKPDKALPRKRVESNAIITI